MRCAVCRHVWHAEASDEELAAAPPAVEAPPEAPAPEEAAPEAEAAEAEDFDEARQRRMKIRLQSNLPAIRRDNAHLVRAGWIALGVFVGGILLSVAFAGEFLVAKWPPISGLYAVFGVEYEVPSEAGPAARSGRLGFQKSAETKRVDGRLDLVIEVTVTNREDHAVMLPAIRGVLRDADKQDIHVWNVDIPDPRIEPGGSRTVTTTVEGVPQAVREYEFFPVWPETDS